MSEPLAAVPADLAPWGEAEEVELNRLVELAAGRCEGARQGAVSLQEKLRGTANFAAVVIALALNALSGFGDSWTGHPWSAKLLPVGLVLLIAALVVASCGYRPVCEPGLGSLVQWRGTLLSVGATRMKAQLIAGFDDVHRDHWKPLLRHHARLAAMAQILLASGLATTAAAAVVVTMHGV